MKERVGIPPQNVSSNINFLKQKTLQNVIDKNLSEMPSTCIKAPLQRDKVATHVTWADKVKTNAQPVFVNIQLLRSKGSQYLFYPD